MTIYREIKDGKKILRIHGHIPHCPLGEAADAALHRVLLAHRDEMREALEPYGIPLEDVALPKFERIIRTEDIDPR